MATRRSKVPEQFARTNPHGFANFLAYCWHHLGLPAPTPVQLDIAHFLQHGPKRKMVKAFRGVGKSWVTAAFVMWLLLTNPDERILVVSASEDRSSAFTLFCKRLITIVPVLNRLEPDPRKDHRNKTTMFDVDGSSAHQSPSMKAAGIFGQITGGRATYIIADDIEVPKNSLTQTMRDRLAEAVTEFEAILIPEDDIDGETGVIYLGTDQTEMSLYKKLPERGYTVKVWPARVPRVAKVPLYGESLAELVHERIAAGAREWEPLDTRFSEDDLIQREASYGRSGFALQFMLDPSLSDEERYPLKARDFIVMDLPDDLGPVSVSWGRSKAGGGKTQIDDLECVGLAGDCWYGPMHLHEKFVEWEGMMMFVDPSGRGKDETGVAVVAQLHGKLYALAVTGYQDGYDDTTLDAIAALAKRFKVKEVRVEPNFGGGVFVKVLQTAFRRNKYPCSIEDAEWARGQKELRIIDSLEPAMNQHRLVLSREVVEEDRGRPEQEQAETYRFVHQLTRLTRERGALAHDDRLEALAGAVAHWQEALDRDDATAEEQWLEAQRDAAFAAFIAEFDGPGGGSVRDTRARMSATQSRRG